MSYELFACRHCETRRVEAIQSGKTGLLRCARNDGGGVSNVRKYLFGLGNGFSILRKYLFGLGSGFSNVRKYLFGLGSGFSNVRKYLFGLGSGFSIVRKYLFGLGSGFSIVRKYLFGLGSGFSILRKYLFGLEAPSPTLGRHRTPRTRRRSILFPGVAARIVLACLEENHLRCRQLLDSVVLRTRLPSIPYIRSVVNGQFSRRAVVCVL